jgi:hypothetical protein
MKIYIAAAVVSLILIAVLFTASKQITVRNLTPQTVSAETETDGELYAVLNYFGMYYFYTDGYFNFCGEHGIDISEYIESFKEINADLDWIAEEKAAAKNIDRDAFKKLIDDEHPSSFRAAIAAKLEEEKMTPDELCDRLLKEIKETPENFYMMTLLTADYQAEQ